MRRLVILPLTEIGGRKDGVCKSSERQHELSMDGNLPGISEGPENAQESFARRVCALGCHLTAQAALGHFVDAWASSVRAGDAFSVSARAGYALVHLATVVDAFVVYAKVGNDLACRAMTGDVLGQFARPGCVLGCQLMFGTAEGSIRVAFAVLHDWSQGVEPAPEFSMYPDQGHQNKDQSKGF